MNTIARREVAMLIALLLILFLSLLPALQHARREARDGQRRQALDQAKDSLEQYFNKHNHYPLTFSIAGDASYTVTEKSSTEAKGWYLRTPLENKASATTGFDEEGNHNFYFRIVNEGGRSYYDICGGIDTCGAPVRSE